MIGDLTMNVYKLRMSILEADEPFSRTIIIRNKFTLLMLEYMITESFCFNGIVGTFYAIQEGELRRFTNRNLIKDLFVNGEYAFYKYEGYNDKLELNIYIELLEILSCELQDVDIVGHEWDYDFCDFCNNMQEYYNLLETLKNQKTFVNSEGEECMLEKLEELEYNESSIRYFMQQAFRWDV